MKWIITSQVHHSLLELGLLHWTQYEVLIRYPYCTRVCLGDRYYAMILTLSSALASAIPVVEDSEGLAPQQVEARRDLDIPEVNLPSGKATQ